jgi:signal transduction histidine kinase
VGLGLSLVQAVAKLHGGSLELTDNSPGLRARMIIEPGALLSGRPRTVATELQGVAVTAEKSEPSVIAL